jgi:FAD:protein FMN transferase
MAALPGLLRVEHVMGMPIVLDVRDEPVDAEAVEAAFERLCSIEAAFSTFRADSEISRLGRGELALEDARPEVREVLRRCDELRVETHGYFDVRAGRCALDPAGYVKGWAVDRAAAILDEAGIRNFAVNAGGDIRTRGGALPAAHWRIGIQHPLRRDRLAAVLAVRDAAVATSGAYERGEHVVDPHTGCAPAGVLSVTVVGPELATADAYATAAFAMGGELGPHWTARLQGHDAMTVLSNRTVLSTPGLPRLEEAWRAGARP